MPMVHLAYISPITTRRAPSSRPLSPDGFRDFLCLCGYRGSVRALRSRGERQKIAPQPKILFCFFFFFSWRSSRICRPPRDPPRESPNRTANPSAGVHAWIRTNIRLRAKPRARARVYLSHTRVTRVICVCVCVCTCLLGAANCHQRCQFAADRRSSVRPDEWVFEKEIIDPRLFLSLSLSFSVFPRYVFRYPNIRFIDRDAKRLHGAAMQHCVLCRKKGWEKRRERKKILDVVVCERC